jgi:hypothetical protein
MRGTPLTQTGPAQPANADNKASTRRAVWTGRSHDLNGPKAGGQSLIAECAGSSPSSVFEGGSQTSVYDGVREPDGTQYGIALSASTSPAPAGSLNLSGRAALALLIAGAGDACVKSGACSDTSALVKRLLDSILQASGEGESPEISTHGQLGDLSPADIERVREDGDVYIQTEDGRIIHVDGDEVVVDEYTPSGQLRNITSIADYPHAQVERNLESGKWISLNE